MPINHRDWNAISDKARSLIAQKGEPFAQGVVIRRDVRRRLVWVTGFGAEPIPMMDFSTDIYVYDEWREYTESSFTLTGSGSFVPNSLAQYFIVEGVGPGGGGAGSSSTGGGMGGGAGGYSKRRISKPAAGWPASYPYACGVGGAAGATSGNGSDGSAATTFGFPALITCNPGQGGNTTNANIGGIGGSAASGDLNLDGGDGSIGGYAVTSGTVLLGGGGAGGNGFYGMGGRGGLQGNGKNGHLYGGGGGGGGHTDGGSNSAGGNGANGGIFITEHRAQHIVKKKLITGTPRVPEVGDLVLLAQHLGSRELPKCVGVLQSFGFAGYDAGLE